MGEGMSYERRPVSNPVSGPAYRGIVCKHELKPTDVSPWARVTPVAAECLQDDGTSAFRSHQAELTRVGVLASRIRSPASITLPFRAPLDIVRDTFGLNLSHARDGNAAQAPSTVDSWSVCCDLGVALYGRIVQLLSMRGSEKAPPGWTGAVNLVGMLLESRLDPVPKEFDVPSVLCFAYGAVALLALGVDRRLLAYWAFRYSQENPRLNSFGVSVSGSLRSEMRYIGRMEFVLGTQNLSQFRTSSSPVERTFLAAQMADEMIAYLTH